MARDLTLKCRCGQVQARVTAITPRRGGRLICHCTDCQAFARHLGAEEILDPNGGTEVFHTLPGRVAFTQGADQLAALQLAERGLYRVYARCCNTPMAAMLRTPKIRFVSLPMVALPDPGDRAAMGPLRASIRASEAPAGAAPPADFGHKAVKRAVILRQILSALRLAPHGSPFFDDQGKPIRAAYVLTEAERAAAYSGGDA